MLQDEVGKVHILKRQDNRCFHVKEKVDKVANQLEEPLLIVKNKKKQLESGNNLMPIVIVYSVSDQEMEPQTVLKTITVTQLVDKVIRRSTLKQNVGQEVLLTETKRFKKTVKTKFCI